MSDDDFDLDTPEQIKAYLRLIVARMNDGNRETRRNRRSIHGLRGDLQGLTDQVYLVRAKVAAYGLIGGIAAALAMKLFNIMFHQP